MTLSDRAVRRVPPVWLARSVEAVRNGLRKATLKSVPPPVGILDATMGSVAGAQTIYAAAQLGIADALADGPLTAEAIAARIGTHPGATERLLRALTMQSVFTRRRDGTYQLTATAQALRSDSAMSVRPLLLMLSHPLYWNTGAASPSRCAPVTPVSKRHTGCHCSSASSTSPTSHRSSTMR
jgi:hypothetical protein